MIEENFDDLYWQYSAISAISAIRGKKKQYRHNFHHKQRRSKKQNGKLYSEERSIKIWIAREALPDSLQDSLQDDDSREIQKMWTSLNHPNHPNQKIV